jgi:hypothetical protein
MAVDAVAFARPRAALGSNGAATTGILGLSGLDASPTRALISTGPSTWRDRPHVAFGDVTPEDEPAPAEVMIHMPLETGLVSQV